MVELENVSQKSQRYASLARQGNKILERYLLQFGSFVIHQDNHLPCRGPSSAVW